MAKKLTAGVLNGTAYRETLTIEWAGEQFEVEIRPLNNKEAMRVEELMQEGIEVKASTGIGGRLMRSMSLDSKANYRGRKKADILCVALGTTDPSITEEVVENEFPPKIVTEIAERIKAISGIIGAETEGAIETFRGDEQTGE